MLFLVRNLSFLAAFIGFFACLQPSNQESSVKWAHIPYSDGGSQWLINVPPEATIEVCGTIGTEEGIRAIKAWAEAINRAAYLKIVPCNTGGGNVVKVTITNQGCQGTAYATPADRAICAGITSLPLYQVIIHEIGHLWGMCDLYSPAYGSCDSANNSGVPESAVMLQGQSEGLLQDDIDGIKALAERADIPTNATWKTFLSQNPAPGGGETQTPPTSPGSLSTDLFMALKDTSSAAAEIYLSSPTTMNRVALCLGDYGTCTQSQFVSVAFSATLIQNNRQIYKSNTPISLQSGQVFTILGWNSANQLTAAQAVDISGK